MVPQIVKHSRKSTFVFVKYRKLTMGRIVLTHFLFKYMFNLSYQRIWHLRILLFHSWNAWIYDESYYDLAPLFACLVVLQPHLAYPLGS